MSEKKDMCPKGSEAREKAIVAWRVLFLFHLMSTCLGLCSAALPYSSIVLVEKVCHE